MKSTITILVQKSMSNSVEYLLPGWKRLILGMKDKKWYLKCGKTRFLLSYESSDMREFNISILKLFLLYKISRHHFMINTWIKNGNWTICFCSKQMIEKRWYIRCKMHCQPFQSQIPPRIKKPYQIYTNLINLTYVISWLIAQI